MAHITTHMLLLQSHCAGQVVAQCPYLNTALRAR